MTFYEVNVENDNNNRHKKKLNFLVYNERSFLHLIDRQTSQTVGLIYNEDKKCLLHLATWILLHLVFFLTKRKKCLVSK